MFNAAQPGPDVIARLAMATRVATQAPPGFVFHRAFRDDAPTTSTPDDDA